jgi:hypothetical protein
VTKLVKLAGCKVTIVEARDEDSEAKDFVVDLANILKDAHWDSRITTEPQRVYRTLVGLLIVVNEEAATPDLEIMSAAESLVAALSSEHIFAQGPIGTPSGKGRIFDGRREPPILVIVGAKPDSTTSAD